MMQNNLTGRPSIIFHHQQVKDVTPIRGINDKIVKSIVGYEANALYLWRTAQNMPMGRARVYRLNSESNLLEKAFDPDVSEKQNVWLTELVCKYPDLRYATKNGEQRVGLKKLKVDGYCPQSNTAFEFDGFYFHGGASVKPSRTKNDKEVAALKKIMAERREATEKKICAFAGFS